MARETPRHREAFEQWYADPDRNVTAIARQYGVTDTAVHKWRQKFGWDARAAERDREVERRARNESIRRQADMLKRHAQSGRALQQQGLKRVLQGIESDQAAIRAVTEGVRVERQSEGLPEWIFEILNASNDELQRKYADAIAEADGDTAGDAGPQIAASDAGNGSQAA